MKNWIHLPLAALVAALVGLGTGLFSESGRGAEAREGNSEATALRATLEELRVQQDTLSKELRALPELPAAAPSTSRAPIQDLDAAIAGYMAKQLSTDAASDGRDDPTPIDLESAAIADRILSGQLDADERQALWQKLRKEKRIDAVVAEIERQAALAPNNPDLQSELGKAYIQKLFDVGVGPMAGLWGEKADKAFDRALALEETHWEARFQKALALSNWPTFLGKQGESMHQFEILMEQQERVAARPEYASTYYYLGNLYDQNGEHEKARAAWQRGLARFPDSEELRQKVGGR